MTLPATLRWAGLALLGIVIAAGISVAASRLASRQIGLASEPISAGDSLAPAAREYRPGHARRHRRGPGGPGRRVPPAGAPTQATAPVAPAPSPPLEELRPSHEGDDGEQGGGGGGG
ncbi:MAG TPA: hypothetical protein VH476_03455, partial [Solirubrobacterales bacterium]